MQLYICMLCAKGITWIISIYLYWVLYVYMYEQMFCHTDTSKHHIIYNLWIQVIRSRDRNYSRQPKSYPSRTSEGTGIRRVCALLYILSL